MTQDELRRLKKIRKLLRKTEKLIRLLIEEEKSDSTETEDIIDATITLQRQLTGNKEETTNIINYASKKENGHYEAAEKLLDFWNSLPYVRKHQRKTTRVYFLSAQKIVQLMRGKFGILNFLDMDWIEARKIPASLLIKKWSEDEIKEGLKNLSCLFDPKYWPSNKAHLPKNLSELLYNPLKKNSLFLFCSATKPRLITESSFLRQVSEYHAKMKGKASPVLNKWFPTPRSLYNEFEKWMQKRNLDSSDTSLRRLDSWAWTRFVKETSEDIGVDLNSGQRIEK